MKFPFHSLAAQGQTSYSNISGLQTEFVLCIEVAIEQWSDLNTCNDMMVEIYLQGEVAERNDYSKQLIINKLSICKHLSLLHKLIIRLLNRQLVPQLLKTTGGKRFNKNISNLVICSNVIYLNIVRLIQSLIKWKSTAMCLVWAW